MGVLVPQIKEDEEQIGSVPVPQIKEDFVNGVRVVPQERVQNRSRDQFVDVPVPQITAKLRGFRSACAS